jgi:hypothetical protein
VDSAETLEDAMTELKDDTEQSNSMRSILVRRDAADATTFQQVYESRLRCERGWKPSLHMIQNGVLRVATSSSDGETKAFRCDLNV